MDEKLKGRKRWITDWWPNRLNLMILRQNRPNSNPYGTDFDYIREVRNLDIDAVIRDLKELMKARRSGGQLISGITVRYLFA